MSEKQPIKFVSGKLSDEANPRPRATMDDWERQQVFREMVVSLLRNGPLSHRRRRQIIQYAAALNITPVLAGRLIDEAHRSCPVPIQNRKRAFLSHVWADERSTRSVPAFLALLAIAIVVMVVSAS